MTEYNILILTAPSGHTTQARAVRSYLEDIPGVRITTLDLAGKEFEWTLFKILYRYAPGLMRIPFELTRNPHTLNIVKNNNIRRFETLLPAILEKEAPDLVITTYHGYIAVLDNVRQHYKFKYVNSITDPVTLHPILFSRSADINIGFNDASCAVGQKLDISPEKIVPAGWLTMRCFFEEQPLAAIRRKLGLKEQLTLLVCAGSEGSNAILNLLPVLFFNKHPRPFQVIFITGHNHALANNVRRTYRLAQRFNPAAPGIVIEEFTTQMQEFMAVSDVVIGKAGPNLIFESTASCKPFLAVTHFSGNEDGNLKMIREYNLGWVAENPFTAGKLIRDFIRNPDILHTKTHDLEKIAERCHNAGLFLREKVLEWKQMDC
jgi:processive 1,2-diacylglycerol beta-glucosyltransferase